MRFLTLTVFVLMTQNAFARSSKVVVVDQPLAQTANITTQDDVVWSSIYDWSVWEKTPMQAEMELEANYVKSGYYSDVENFESLYREDIPQIEELAREAVGEDSAEATTLSLYLQAQPEYPEPSSEKRNAVASVVQVQKQIPDSVNVSNLTIDDFTRIVQKADAPHLYYPVSTEWVHKFLRPTHGGHPIVEENPEAKYFYTVINAARKYYSCKILNIAMGKFGERAINLPTVEGGNRFLMLNMVKDVTEKADKLSSFLPAGAKKVFEQRTIFASHVLKSGVNYIAFYDDEKGKRMVLTSVVVSSKKLVTLGEGILDQFVYGASALRAAIGYKNTISLGESGVFKIGQDTLGIQKSNERGSCSKGIGQGIINYIYNLSSKVVEEISND